jgi:hypothetical protein
MDEFTEDQKRQLEDLIIDLEAKGLTQEEIQSQIDIKKLEFLNLEKEQTPQKEEDATVELDVASTDTDFNLEDTSSDLLNENPFYTVTAEDLNKSEEQAVPALNKILAASGIFLEQSTAFGNSDAVNLRNYNDIDKNAGGLKEGDLRRSISDASLNLIGNPIDIFTSVGIGKDLTPEERQEAADKINEYIKENGNSNHIKEARERNFDTWKEYAKFIEAPEIEEKELIKAYKEDLLSSFNQVLAKENPNTEILNTDGFPSAQLPVEAVAATIEDFANQEQFDDYKEWKENNYIKDPSEQALIQYDAERKEKYALDESVSFANDLNSKDRLDVLAIAADEAATTRDFITEFNDFNKTKDTFDQSLEQYKTNPTPENYITASTIQLEYLKELGEIQDLQDKLNKQGVLDRSQAVPLALQDFHKDYNRLRQLRSGFKRLGTDLGFATAQLAILAGSRSNPIALGSYLTKPSLLNKDIESSTGLVSLGQEMQDETNNFQRAIEVDRIKNLSDAGRWTAGATVNLIPSLSMAFTGGAAMPLFFLSGYGSKGMETAINQKVASERLIANRNFLDENPNIDFFKKMAIESEMKKDAEVLNLNGWETLGVQALYGIAEVVFEKLGTMTLLNNIKKGIKMLPPKTIKEGAAFVGKQLAKGGIREGGSEFATTFTQNLVDITILGEDKNVFEGGLESFSQGFLMGGGMNMVNVSKGLRQSLVSFTASKEELTILQSKLLEIRNLTGRKDLESWTQLEDGIKRKRLKKPVQNQVDRLVNEMKTIEDGVLFKLGTTLSKKQAIAVDEKGRLMRAINKQFIQAVSDLRNSPSELAAVEKSLKAEFEKLENEREALLNDKVGQEQTKKSYTNSQLSEISNSGYQLYDMRMLNESITGIVADYNNLSPEAILEFDEKAKLELGENASVDQIKDRAMNIYVDKSYRQRIMVGMRNSVDFSVQQGLNIDFQSFSGENSKEETITALENIGVINNSKKGKEARRLVEKGLFEGWSGKVDGVNTVIVDVESAVKNRRIGIFAHEILHVYANERYGDDVDSAGENLLNYLEQNQPDVFAKVKYRIDQSYTKKDADGKVVKEKDYYKEAMNAMSDVLADGQNLKGNALNSLRLFANSFLTELPSALKFSVDQSQEAFQFVKNYNKDSHMGGASANTKGKVIVTFPPKRMSITNTGNAGKVINTVKEGVKNAIANNENIKSIKFTSDFSEKSRTRLYKSIAEKVSEELNWNLEIYEDAFDFDGEREITSTEYELSKKTSSKKLKNNKNSLQFRKKPKTEGYQKAISDGMPIGAGKEGFTSSFEVNGKKYSVYLAQVSYDGVNIDGQYELSFSLVDEANKQLSVPMVNNLSTQEFSKQFSYLKDVGAEFDFSEFNKVENKRTRNKRRITSEDVKRILGNFGYNQLGNFSVSAKSAYEKILTEKRPELKDPSKQIDNLFEWVDTLDIPENKKNKHERLALFYMGNGNLILPEDGYKVEDAIKVAAKNKLDPYSYTNPNSLLEKFSGDITVKKINPDNLSTFSNKKEFADGITIYKVENTKAGQQDVRKIIDSDWGKKANPWCIAARIDGNLDRAWNFWQDYKGEKQIAFINNKLLAFNAKDQSFFNNASMWYNRMDVPNKNLTFSKKTNDSEGLKMELELDTENNSTEKIGYFVGNTGGKFFKRYDIDKNLIEEYKVTKKPGGNTETYMFKNIGNSKDVERWKDGASPWDVDMVFYTLIENGIIEEDPTSNLSWEDDFSYDSKNSDNIKYFKKRYININHNSDNVENERKVVLEDGETKYTEKFGDSIGTVEYRELNGVKFVLGFDLYDFVSKTKVDAIAGYDAWQIFESKLKDIGGIKLLEDVKKTAFLLDSNNTPIIPKKFPFLNIKDNGFLEVKPENYNESGSFSYTTKEGRKIDDLVGGKDKDGNYIMTKAEWDAGGIKDAYDEVNKPDGLFQPTIRKGIQGDEIQGISRSEFDDNVRFKIVEILMKFNPEKNNSLSGYVNSLAYRRKGDALKQAKKTPTGRSLDTPVGEVGSVQEIGAEDDVDFDTIIGYDAGTEIAEKKGKKVKTELNLSKEETKSIEDNIDKTFSELKEDDFSFKKLPNLAAATIAEKLGVRTSRITETSGNDLNSREFNILQSFIKTNVSLFNQLLPEGYIGPDAAVSEGLKNTATKVPNRLEQNLKLYTPDGNKYVRNDNISDIDILESIGIVDGKIVNSNPRGPVARQIKGFMSLMTRTATNQFVREKLYKLKQSPDVVRKIADTEAGKGIGMFSKSLDDAKNKAAKENNDKLPAEFKLAKGASNERVLERLAQIDDENNEARKDYFASKPLSKEFNEILENKKGIAAAAKEKVYEKAVASLMGKKLDKRFSSMLSGMYLGNNANDFLGLLYKTLGKKQIGNKQLAWIKTNLLNPYAVAMNNITDSRAALFRDYNTLKSKLKIVPKNLEKTIPDMAFTNSHAVRVYIWNKQGFSVPEISERDKRDLVAIVRDDPKLKLFAEQLVYINKQTKYPEAEKGWQSGNITTDLQNSINQNKRAKYLEQWQENVDTIFSEKNLNKLEVLYGTKYREAIEGTLSRMKTGRNKNMEQGKPELLYNRFVNGAIGNVMFFNTKSALLQTISLANFVNLTDNNVLAASKAFANQPQFWKDFSKLFNSNYLKERRGDLKMNVNEADLAAIAKKDGLKGVFAKLLQIGFLPTQLADSFAIASGGATFYRNRVKSLLKQTNSDGKKIYTEKQAQDKAFLDFREIAEESQQSSRPDKISQEQASTLGRTILAFANAPAQYARIIQKAASDLKNGRGDRATNVSRILYYGFVQNVIFNFLQQGLFSLAFGDDEELTGKEETKIINVANGMLDSLLRGSGIFGAIAATAKNVGVEFYKQYNKPYGSFNPSKFLEAAVSFSPPMQTKIRKVNKFSRNLKWDREEIDKASNQLKNKEFQKFLNNPALEAGAMAISATTNIPIDRLINKTINVTDALTRDLERWQQISLLLGYDKWLLNIDEPKQFKINYKYSKDKQKNYY